MVFGRAVSQGMEAKHKYLFEQKNIQVRNRDIHQISRGYVRASKQTKERRLAHAHSSGNEVSVVVRVLIEESASRQARLRIEVH